MMGDRVCVKAEAESSPGVCCGGLGSRVACWS